MKIAIISFSRAGYGVSEVLHNALKEKDYEVETYAKSKYTKTVLDEAQLDENDQVFRNAEQFAKPVDVSLKQWTGMRFEDSDDIVFIGACGIAVRSIASFVKSKQTDPAVVAVDENGKFAISLLSGHIGGANELTAMIAELLDAVPVITTATDINNKFAVDVFARQNGCFISDMQLAKEISAALVNGQNVGFVSDFPWYGEVPAELTTDDGENKPELGIYITDSYVEHPFVHTLYLIPRVITVGVGCKKNTPKETVERVIRKACDELLIPSVAMEQVASIDLKKDEEGIKGYCEDRNLPFITFSSEELEAVEGTFAGSDFVKEVTGVDNVCERSAILGSSHGDKSILVSKKYAEDGVTVALAKKKWSVQFE